MSRFIKLPLLQTLIPLSLVFATQGDAESVKERDLVPCRVSYRPRVKLGTKQGNGIGYEKGYSSGSLFLVPPIDSNGILFLDMRAHMLNDTRLAANIGGGARIPIKHEKCFLGFNAFYDYRSAFDLSLNQAGFGAEILTRKLDFRVNGYLPIGKKQHQGELRDAHVIGHQIHAMRKTKGTFPVFEGEVGISPSFGKPPLENVYLAAGPYLIGKKQIGQKSVGGCAGIKGRFETRLFRGVHLGIEGSYDPLFKGRAQVSISWITSLKPLFPRKDKKERVNCSRYYPLSEKASNFVQRREIIPSISRKDRIAILEGDRNAYFVHQGGGLGGDGSIENPFNSLSQVHNVAGENDLIFVSDHPLQPNKLLQSTQTNLQAVGDTGIVLKKGQILHGTGKELYINGTKLPPLTPELHPIVSSSSGAAITLADNCVVQHVKIDGAAKNGIFGENVRNVTIKQVDLKGTGDDAIRLSNVSGTIDLERISVGDITQNKRAIEVIQLASDATINLNNSDFTNLTDEKEAVFFVTNGNSRVTSNITNCRFDSINDDAIQAQILATSELNLNIADSSFTNAAGTNQFGGINLIGKESSKLSLNVNECTFDGLMQGTGQRGMITVNMMNQSELLGSLTNSRFYNSNQDGVALIVQDSTQKCEFATEKCTFDKIALRGFDVNVKEDALSANRGRFCFFSNQFGLDSPVGEYGISVLSRTNSSVRNLNIVAIDNTIIAGGAQDRNGMRLISRDFTQMNATITDNKLINKSGSFDFYALTNGPNAKMCLRLQENEANNGQGTFFLRENNGEFTLFDLPNVQLSNRGTVSIGTGITNRITTCPTN